MIQTLSQTEADHSGLPPSRVQCISPYVNPAHVLSPPRHWLEALLNGRYSWPFFRLRYKHLLRSRFKAEPERFFTLLTASEAGGALHLTCHCLTEHCHRELAREFLEHLRANRPAVGAPRRTAKRPPPPRAHAPRQGMVLATLIEHPLPAHSRQP